MSGDHYPNLKTVSLRVLLSADPGGEITPALVARITGDPADFAAIMADLNRVQMVEDDNTLTPLADRYATMCRKAVATGRG